MIQDLLGSIYKPLAQTQSWTANLLATSLCVAGWGWFLYQGVIDPLGGINSLWPLFGIANQMLAGIALLLATSILFKMKQDRFAWVTLLPTLGILSVTLTAAVQKIASDNPKIGFLAHSQKFSTALQQNNIIAPAKSLSDMQHIILNDRVDAILCFIFITVVILLTLFSIKTIIQARKKDHATVVEMPAKLELL